MKKALVHDWFVTYAGAERCVESITNIWDDFDIFSLIDYLTPSDREIIIKNKPVHTSFIQKMPFSKTKYRNYLPFYPIAIENFDLSDYNVILSSSHAVAKGVLTRPDQLHIAYIYSPMRYVWDLYHQYLFQENLDKGLKGVLAKYFLHKLRIWDQSTINRPDVYFCISRYIASRIKKLYGKDAEVIYPPVDTDKFTLRETGDNYYVTSSRMVPYKKMDLIVEAFSKTTHKLIVVGDGPDFRKIKKIASGNIELVGHVSQDEMVSITQKAKAFVFAAEEDFGIAPVEAQACGVPVIAFGRGGSLETVKGCFPGEAINQNHTGLFFEKQDVPSLINAIDIFEKNRDTFDPSVIREHSLTFSRQRFESLFNEKISRAVEEWCDQK